MDALPPFTRINTPKECLKRLEALYLLSGYDVPYKAITHQIGRSIDLIIQKKKSNLRVVSHKELTDISGDQVLMQDIKLSGHELYVSGLVPKSIKRLEKHGFDRKLFSTDF